MKTLKTILHYWIAVASLIGFLGGWITLAHAGKPLQPNQPTTSLSVQALQPSQPGQALPTLAPLDMTGNSSGNTSNNNSFFQILTQPQQQQSGFPVLVTKGS